MTRRSIYMSIAAAPELVPDGTHVAAQSNAQFVGGNWVKLRAWRMTGEASYTIVGDTSGAVRERW